MVSNASFAQKNTDEQLAVQYFNNKEYDKAIVYFEKLYNKDEGTYYNYYLKCLIQTKDLKKAEKVAKRQIKNNSYNLSFYLDLADVYKADEDEKKATEQYDKAVKDLKEDYAQVNTLGKAFTEKKLYDYAIATYNKGKKIMNDVYPFYYEKAEVYRQKGDLKAMINEYLDALEFQETEFLTVQNKLQNSLGYDDETGGFNNPVLKVELNKRIQKSPEKTIFSELLIYIQMQQKDFDGAITQAKALDKRKKEDGYRLMELGKTCISNEYYDGALRCFEYVMSKGKDNYNYDEAHIQSINAQYEKIIRTNIPNQIDLVDLESKLDNAINKFGKRQATIQLIRKKAYVQAYYLNKTAEATALLNECIELTGIEKQSTAEMKLDLGDILLLTNQIWDASLLYSQVEKTFKYEPIGQEAKFRNAKLSYYAGDFEWSKSQLDVLKGATSKLIANDAMDLSLIIGDAIAVDTNVVPLQMFSSAELLILQNKTAQGLMRMDSINIIFDNHSLADDIYFKKAKVFMKQGGYKEALEAFQRVVDNYGDEIFGDDALYNIALIYHYNLQDTEKAKLIYQEILTKYPGSVYTVEARKQYRKLRGDNIK